ncbi:MAG TPA: YqgE/AlgH family protein [Acidimicrobiales bacterium]
MTDGLSGRLLIAGPSLGDPNFDRTIVYLLEHAAEGALGVVLNRPSALEVRETLPQWTGTAAPPGVIFSGGPVEADAVLGLARVRDATDCAGWTSIDGTIGTVDLAMDPDGVLAGVDEVRIYLGYAGWGAGQLDEEVGAGAWFVVEPGPDDVFNPAPDRLWGEVLRRDAARNAMAVGNPSWN